jgi:hypothetical protein
MGELRSGASMGQEWSDVLIACMLEGLSKNNFVSVPLTNE